MSLPFGGGQSPTRANTSLHRAVFRRVELAGHGVVVVGLIPGRRLQDPMLLFRFLRARRTYEIPLAQVFTRMLMQAAELERKPRKAGR